MDAAKTQHLQVFFELRPALDGDRASVQAKPGANRPASPQWLRAKCLKASYEGLGSVLWRSSPEESQKLHPPRVPGTGSRQSNQKSRWICQLLRLWRTSLNDF